MPRGKNTKEYQTVKKSYPDLSDAIAGPEVIDWVCERLLAKGLITDGQRAAASNGFVTAKNRASTVTGLLLNKVEQDTKYFQMLVDVLQQDTDTFGTVLEQMGVTVRVDDESSSAVVSGSTNGAAMTSGNTDYPCTPANLEIELNEITQPYQFGLQLGMAPSDLRLIEKNHPGDVARQRTEVIIYWSRNYECTWEKVADALKKLGGHGNLEKKLRQMHTKGPTGSASACPDLKDDKVHVKVPVEPKAPVKFSDNLSPNDLVAWLSQELLARGLTLDDAVKDKLIEEEINGEAFKDLSKQDLKDMGFKMGPCKNILKIIEDLNK